MPTGLERHYGKGDLHFITFSCYRRLPLLTTVRARDIFVQELARVRTETAFRLFGYVVMPEHVHLLMSEPKVGTPSAAVQKLKQRVSRKIRGRESRERSRRQLEDNGEPFRSFWQARFYDFSVYSKGKKKEKLNYMHANPVIRGLVEHPRDWPWSSWSFYFGGAQTLVQMDVER
ncbi:MAG TPA: transposase [Candidatus Sulfotelmatobacter sp.]|nr:transposase [Candidatus Sulfotelmatobacter sp.]